MSETRSRLRAALARAGAVAAAGRPRGRVGPPPAQPFAAARTVDGEPFGARAVGEPTPWRDPVGFVDGVQRYAVIGHIGVTPIVRAVVAAAALERVAGRLHRVALEREEFLVVPDGRLESGQRVALEEAGLAIVAAEAGTRAHPLMDLVAAGEAIEQRRGALERVVARTFRTARPAAWILLDGTVTADDGPRTVGLIKSHETQFLEGAALEAALTLPCGHRSGVFTRVRRSSAYTWYLRLWPWADRDLLHGLVRVERATATSPEEADDVSRWLLAERAPIARDARWDRLLYPVREVETYLQAGLAGWP